MKEKFLSDNWNSYEVNFQGSSGNDSVLAHNHGLHRTGDMSLAEPMMIQNTEAQWISSS